MQGRAGQQQQEQELAVKGRARCGCVGGDFVAVAAGGALCFFPLPASASPASAAPRLALQLENASAMRRLRCPREEGGGGGLVASLREDGTLSLWQPFASALRPLLGVLNPSVAPAASSTATTSFMDASAVVTDMDFSPNNTNIIAAGAQSGAVHIFDTRAPFTMQRSLFCGDVDGSCTSVVFSSNPYTLASCHKSKILLWDLRTGTDAGAPGSTTATAATSQPVFIINTGSEQQENFQTCAWSSQAASCLISVSRVDQGKLLGEKQSIQWWNSLTGEREATRDIDNVVCEENVEPLLLPTLTGRGVVISHQKLLTSSSEKNTITTSATVSSSLKLHQKIREISSSAATSLGDITPTSFALTLFGFPRPDRSLSSIFVPPPNSTSTGDYPQKNSASGEDASHQQSYPSSELMQVPTARFGDDKMLKGHVDSSFLCLKWAPSNRLVANLQGGNEILVISASVSRTQTSSEEHYCSLHVISLSNDTLSRFTVENGSNLDVNNAPTRSRLRYNKHQTLSSRSLQTVHKSRSTLSASTAMSVMQTNPPKYSIAGLHRDWVRPSNVSNDFEFDQENTDTTTTKEEAAFQKSQTFPIKTQSLLQKYPHRGQQMRGNEHIGFWGQLQDEVLALEESLQKGILSGLTLGRIDQYARQITIEISRPRSALLGLSHQEATEDVSDLSTLSALLIISFPEKFSSSKVFPTFTVRSLYDSAPSSDDAMQEAQHSVMISLEAELAEVAKSALLHSHKYASSLNSSNSGRVSSSGFLLDVARCFWNRVQQVWCEIHVGSGNNTDISTGDGFVRNNNAGTGEDSDVRNTQRDVTDISQRNKAAKESRERVIDARAYRICSPISSGGIFSCTGSLSLFGGCNIQLSQVTKDNSATWQQPDVVSSSNLGAQDTSSSPSALDGKSGEHDNTILLTSTSKKKLKKKSSALGIPVDQYSFFPSPITSRGNSSATVESTMSSQAVRPKTYADLLLQQRELKLAYNTASRRARKRKNVASARNSSRHSQIASHERSMSGNAGSESFAIGGRNATQRSAQIGNIRNGSYLAHFLKNSGVEDSGGDDSGGVDTEESVSNSDSISHEDTSSDVDIDVDNDSEIADHEATQGSASTSTTHNFFNTSLDELGAKLDRSQEEEFGFLDDEGDDVVEDEDEDYDEEEVRRRVSRRHNSDDIRRLSEGGNATPRLAQRYLISNSITTDSPLAVTIWMYICGAKRYNLAKEYTFSSFHPHLSQNAQPIDGTLVSALTQAHNRLHSSSDPDINQQKYSTPVSKSVAGVSDVSTSMGKRVASMNNLSTVVFNSPPRTNEHWDYRRIPSFHGKCSNKDEVKEDEEVFKPGQSVILSGDENVISNGGDVPLDVDHVSTACATNSTLAKKWNDDQLSNLWHLLSVSLNIMSITKYVLRSPHAQQLSLPLADPDDVRHRSAQKHIGNTRHTSANSLDSCRIMVRCGVSKDWTVHSLGRPLFSRIFAHLRKVGDLQTLAVLICTVGGPYVMSLMLGDYSLYTSSSLDKILLRYADVLHRWQCHVHATEVSKFVSLSMRDCSSKLSSSTEVAPQSSLLSMQNETLNSSPPPTCTSTSCTKQSASVFSFQVNCNQCNQGVGDDFWCRPCNAYAFRCSICENVLRGIGFFCPGCGHGGHGDHVKAWFSKSPDCPIGCGCRCTDYSLTPLTRGNSHDVSNDLANSMDYKTLYDDKPYGDETDTSGGGGPARRFSGSSIMMDRSSTSSITA